MPRLMLGATDILRFGGFMGGIERAISTFQPSKDGKELLSISTSLSELSFLLFSISLFVSVSVATSYFNSGQDFDFKVSFLIWNRNKTRGIIGAVHKLHDALEGRTASIIVQRRTMLLLVTKWSDRHVAF